MATNAALPVKARCGNGIVTNIQFDINPLKPIVIMW